MLLSLQFKNWQKKKTSACAPSHSSYSVIQFQFNSSWNTLVGLNFLSSSDHFLWPSWPEVVRLVGSARGWGKVDSLGHKNLVRPRRLVCRLNRFGWHSMAHPDDEFAGSFVERDYEQVWLNKSERHVCPIPRLMAQVLIQHGCCDARMLHHDSCHLALNLPELSFSICESFSGTSG